MIELHTLPPAFGQRNPSPFCLKIEMALTHLNLDFEILAGLDLNKAPKGKVPWLVDGGITADSELILEHLDKKTNGGLYRHLTEQEKAIGTAFTRLAEDHLYWVVMASRWLDDNWFPNVKRGFFSTLPIPLRWIIPRVARRQVRQAYRLHGLGRHTHEEQAGLLHRDLQAVAGQVSSNKYIAGNRLTVYDFAVASLLAAMLDNKPDTWVSTLANRYQPLRDYTENVQRETGVFCREL